ncbi:MAG: hypothetical protein JWQ87_2896 [Candidatus Sulfotelmatobacter sp.]|nr:hypothetical protein [Candidatus Sulfotelmatobacter sp.]
MDFGYWNALISTRRWHGRRRPPSPAMWPVRCASFFSTRLRTKERNSLIRRDFGICTILATKAALKASRMPHFSRSLREVGLFADTLPNPQPALRRIFSSHQIQSLIRTNPASPYA